VCLIFPYCCDIRQSVIYIEQTWWSGSGTWVSFLCTNHFMKLHFMLSPWNPRCDR
jgi:hypothetical protein